MDARSVEFHSTKNCIGWLEYEWMWGCSCVCMYLGVCVQNFYPLSGDEEIHLRHRLGVYLRSLWAHTHAHGQTHRHINWLHHIQYILCRHILYSNTICYHDYEISLRPHSWHEWMEMLSTGPWPGGALLIANTGNTDNYWLMHVSRLALLIVA